MRFTLALLALPAATLAVSLVDFPPRVTGLSSSCQSVYTQVISGCSNSDFASAKSCSVGCIEALQALTVPVQEACSDDTNVGGTVINAFLHNAGTGAVCGNAASVLATLSSATPSSTVAPSSSAAATSSAAFTSSAVSSAAPMSTTSPSSSADDSTTSPSDSSDSTADSTTSDLTSSTSSIILTGTSTASPLATTTATTTVAPSHTTSTSLIVDTSSSPTTSSSHKPAVTGNSQSSANSGSGGGSPFDSTGNQASAGNALEVLSYGMAGVSGLVFAMIWL